ncbi:cardiolipin synthase [Ectobacillus ponti]|uniref:Cardiolipin synthase n=1 Tax=Ectobacillus ponti TaxID=2961894 RepID=A0AA41X807_9BACI|nr:cardiolipin synthase [Ectobacillus ponti]MCP8967973.1 cardiolipin synthase [Ectobacillus ponti]
MTVFLLVLLLFIAWLPVDFWLGRRRQLKRVRQRAFPRRKSDFRLYTYGKMLYRDLFADIEQAKDHIHILFFIVKNDAVSQRFLQLLMKKAQEGVEVRLLLDRVGSHLLSRKSIRELRRAGVHFAFCHNPRFPYFFYSINQRNHRKITVIDGKIGYVGGFNIGEEYLGNDPKLGNWRDYHLRLTGEGVQDLQTQFLHDWRDDTKENLLRESRYFPPLLPGAVEHYFVPTDGAYLQQTFLDLIEMAQHDIYIGTPYFIPGKRLMDALIQAAQRGVRIAVLVPKKSDHPLVREAKFPYMRQLLREGCDVYEFLNGFFHAKIFIVDGHICDIGTANFDLRSLYINHEMNCIMQDSSFFAAIKKEVDEDLEASRKLTLEDVERLSFGERLKEKIGTIIAFFL